LLYLILGFTISQAQEQSASGAASLNLAGADLCLQDGWSVNNNPAGLAFLEEINFSASYRSDFLLRELSSRSFAFSLPKEKQGFAVSGGQSGFSDYRTNRLGLAFAQRLSQNFSLGLQFNYHSLQISDPYGSQSFYTVNLGFLTNLSPKLDLGALIVNPNRANAIHSETAYSPQAIEVGLKFCPQEFLSLFLQVEKELVKPLAAMVAVQYQYAKKLDLRLGTAYELDQMAFGFGYRQTHFRFDVASFYHMQLGFSPSVSISYFPQSDDN